MGMTVIYYDVVNLMSLGTSRQVPTLEELLSRSDFVSLHVPELPETKNMMGAEQMEQMRQGSYLINASRGTVVDIPALIHAMRTGKIAGAALDVYPNEPAGNGDYFNNDLNKWGNDLRGLKNIILTPHIGGSTEEAQSAIGIEVGQALVRYVNEGTTLGAVNLPEVNLRSLTIDEPDHARVSRPFYIPIFPSYQLKQELTSQTGYLYSPKYSRRIAKRFVFDCHFSIESRRATSVLTCCPIQSTRSLVTITSISR